MNDGFTLAAELVHKVSDRQVGPCRLIVLPYESDGLVSVAGSVSSFPDIAAGEDQLQALVNAMLDKGTRHRDQFEVARALESVGAERAYSGGAVRVRFSGRSLKKAVGSLVGVIAEELREPLFDARQFDLLKQRMIARLRQSIHRTGILASDALHRHWFEADHPNHSRTISTELLLLGATDIEELRLLHASHFGSDDLIVVMVGDIKPDPAAAVVARAFGGWREARSTPTFSVDARRSPRKRREDIRVPDKPSIDVVLGIAVPITRGSPDFLPLMVGNFVLGGNFSSRLMQRIRDDMGLTYGVRSSLTGVSIHHDMLWEIHVTLGADVLEIGISEIQKLVRELAVGGITGQELERAKETLTGAYLVRQDSSGNMAHTILVNTERGDPVQQLADYPLEVEAVTQDQVNRALASYLRAEDFSIAAAGTLSARKDVNA
jgi:predicted Zn-dependent peptidase